MQLTPDEVSRYTQQLKLPQIGIEGQLKLKNARVLCIGAGGLGSSALLYLAAAGVGTIGIIDHDVVELNNLHRQILYQYQHIGLQKSLIAKKQLSALNPQITIHTYCEQFNSNNAREIVAQYDLVIDCSDNFLTHYLTHDVCFYENKPYVFASISQFKGQCAFFLSNTKPCLHCLFPISSTKNISPDCAEGGVLGVLPGLLGTIQATEVIKWLLQLNDVLLGRLLAVDILKMQFQTFFLTKDPQCELCVQQKSIEFLQKSITCDRYVEYKITAEELRKKLEKNQDVVLLDVRTVSENAVYNLGGILMPLNELPHRLTELDPYKKIIIYCQSDKRSIEAMKILLRANFRDVKYLQGGINEWSKHESPLLLVREGKRTFEV